MKLRSLCAGLALLMAVPTPAAPPRHALEFAPITCIRGGELPLLQVRVKGQGELRAYFRRINTSDWCSVEGVNQGPLSRVVLPKFQTGDEIEYFFVLLDGRRVVARSQRIFRSRVTMDCGIAWARHVLPLKLSCGEEVGALPSAMSAGMMVDEEWIDEIPPQESPDRPTRE